MTIAYVTGTINLVNGSTAVVGVGTAWQTALIVGGLLVPSAATGNAMVIDTVTDNTHMTAAKAWTGPTGNYGYALIRDTAYLKQVAQNATALSQIIDELRAGTLFKYDVAAPFAQRATYNTQPAGFAFLATDSVPFTLYIKNSATSGDWSAGARYAQGERGPAPSLVFGAVTTAAPGTAASVTTSGSGTSIDPYSLEFTIPSGLTGMVFKGTYAAGTAYVFRDAVLYNGSTWYAKQATTGNAPPNLPATFDANWQLVSIKGTDGTGIGDVVGPTSSTDGDLAVFSGTTGKLLGRASALFGMRNKIINGNFAINQRMFAGGALAANTYGHDRWKAGASGCTYTVSGAVATITAGTLSQVIEPNIITSGPHTLSWAGTATATLNGAAIANGSSVSLVSGLVTIVFSTGTVSNVQLEFGSLKTAFEQRIYGLEMILCQRFYEKSYDRDTAPGSATATPASVFWPGAAVYRKASATEGDTHFNAVFKVEKRVIPTVTWYNPGSGASARIFNSALVLGMVVTGTSPACLTSTKAVGSPAHDASGAQGNTIIGHWTAEAEI
jgi:hypothetical protein